MENIEKFLGKELNWLRDKTVGLALRAFGETINLAELNVKGVFASNAEGRSAQGSWKFKRAGMLKNNVSLIDGGTGQEIAVFKKKGLGGSLEFKNGDTYSVTRNALMTEYSLLKDNQSLITFQYKDKRPQMVLEEGIRQTEKSALLAIFLGYLMIMQRIDARFNAPF